MIYQEHYQAMQRKIRNLSFCLSRFPVVHCFVPWKLQSFPKKPWAPEKIFGMFIVSPLIRSEVKPQKITATLISHDLTKKKQRGGLFFYMKSSGLPFSNTEFFFLILALVSPKNRDEWHFMEKWFYFKKTGSVDQKQLDSVSESQQKNKPITSNVPLCLSC